MSAILDRYRPLFDPRDIIVARASSHPGKLGFVAASDISSRGGSGRLF